MICKTGFETFIKKLNKLDENKYLIPLMKSLIHLYANAGNFFIDIRSDHIILSGLVEEGEFVKQLEVFIEFLVIEVLTQIGFQDIPGVIGNLLFHRSSNDGEKLYKRHQDRFRHGQES